MNADSTIANVGAQRAPLSARAARRRGQVNWGGMVMTIILGSCIYLGAHFLPVLSQYWKVKKLLEKATIVYSEPRAVQRHISVELEKMGISVALPQIVVREEKHPVALYISVDYTTTVKFWPTKKTKVLPFNVDYRFIKGS